jgi:hypothetical protein
LLIIRDNDHDNDIDYKDDDDDDDDDDDEIMTSMMMAKVTINFINIGEIETYYCSPIMSYS